MVGAEAQFLEEFLVWNNQQATTHQWLSVLVAAKGRAVMGIGMGSGNEYRKQQLMK